MIQFDLPKEQSSIIKVIGVGGGGSNAVNHMYAQDIENVNFIICNTDAQAIAQSKVPNKIQLGPHLTQGLGAGANPAIGRQATEESLEEIKRILEVNTKMAFITAGMGGGTGTGGAPILAKICQDLGILTVGIVTTPFAYEGKKRIAQAEEGIMQLKNHVDTLLVISNDKLRHQFGNLKMKEAFGKADDVLATAAKCITDVINTTGQINVDFADVCTVMRKGGVAILGSATASGEHRAQLAIENALTSPLLNDNDIRGAKWILININSTEGEFEFTMDEVEIIQEYILSQAGENTDVIMGMGYDNTLGDQIGITLIATGFEHKDPFAKESELNSGLAKKDQKIVMELEMPAPISKSLTMPVEPEVVLVSEEKPAPSVEVTSTAITIETQSVEADPMMPTLKEEITLPIVELKEEQTDEVEILSKNTVEKIEEAPVFFEISSAADQAPTFTFDLTQEPPAKLQTATQEKTATNNQTEQKSEEKKEIEHTATVGQLSSGGFLVKPTQIYVEDHQSAETKSNTSDEPLPLQITFQEDEPAMEMQLVVKEPQNAAEVKPEDHTQPIMMSTVEEPALQDETEEHRRRAMDRIAKLRNLSFNINAADPNNEFETVPAYLRRNMELHNQIADVESFYSNYTVKADQNNQVEISSLNTFLEGKKPD